MVENSFNLFFKILTILSKHNILNINVHNVTPTYPYKRQKYTLDYLSIRPNFIIEVLKFSTVSIINKD